MKKAIVYSTTTGNTEAMAHAIADGAVSSGADVIFTSADEASADEVLSADLIILGCPAMGDEELEDSMEAFFSSISGGLSGKKVALFGSYDWGDGQWLRTWADRIVKVGGVVVNGSGLMAHLTPDEGVLAECGQLGKTAV